MEEVAPESTKASRALEFRTATRIQAIKTLTQALHEDTQYVFRTCCIDKFAVPKQ